MKKIISLIIVIAALATMLVSCGQKDYELAIGVVITENDDASKATQTVATIVTDADGKIVLCRLDCVDYEFKNGLTAPVSKVEKGDSYGTMPKGTWYVQGAALEKYVVGKTQAEIAGIAVNGYVTDADLKASCSINVADLLAAIDNAFKSPYKMAFKAAGALTAGLNASSSVKADGAGFKLSTDYAVAVMSDGNVAAAILDSVEITVASGSVTCKGSKRAQGTGYDSYSPMPSGTWYVQADVYAKTAIGLNKDNIASLASGVAGCSIYAGGYKAGIEAAVKAAR